MDVSPLLLLLLTPCLGIDNGIGLTPPQGWRSWNCYTCTDSDSCAKNPDTCNMTGNNVLTESKMKRAMHGVMDKSRKLHNGTVVSLADLGYNWVSMDDGWQGCNCSTHQMVDLSLPKCSIGDCRSGKCSWHDPITGMPKVKGDDATKPESNTNRFPNGMKSLVDYGHSLGLKVGSYLNNCICMERGKPQYEQDVEWLVNVAGFDGVKIDNCGGSHNVTYYAELFNKTGKHIRIEDCHTYPAHSSIVGGKFFCPMNMFRTGGDISAAFGSIYGEIMSTISFNDADVPLSRPGCWAYPDMMQVGNFKGQEPTRSHEEQTHFGLWTINSAPLVLGFDLGDASRVDRVWPTITNADALSINQQWAGHPGTLVKAYPAVDYDQFMAVPGPCGSSSSKGWSLQNGVLVGSTKGFCVDGSQSNVGGIPATRGSGLTKSGINIRNCSKVTNGNWSHNSSTDTIAWTPKKGGRPFCIGVQLGQGLRPTDKLVISTGICDKPGVTSAFEVTSDGELRNQNGTCIVEVPWYGVQMWSKPLLQGKVAVLFLNPLDQAQNISIPLADVPGQPCSKGACAVRDVWAQQDIGSQSDHLSISLATHQTAYYILTPPGTYVSSDLPDETVSFYM